MVKQVLGFFLNSDKFLPCTETLYRDGYRSSIEKQEPREKLHWIMPHLILLCVAASYPLISVPPDKYIGSYSTWACVYPYSLSSHQSHAKVVALSYCPTYLFPFLLLLKLCLTIKSTNLVTFETLNENKRMWKELALSEPYFLWSVTTMSTICYLQSVELGQQILVRQ